MKVSIIGANLVGSTIAFSLMQMGMATEICINDASVRKSEVRVKDLSDGLSFTKQTNIYMGDIEDTKNSDLIIVTIGKSPSVDVNRFDLIQKNYDTFKAIIPNLARYSPSSILLIVSNPVDILTQTAYELSGFPKNRVIGTGTILDTSRLRQVISKCLNVSPFAVNGSVIGEYGHSEFIHWSSVTISNIPLTEYVQSMGITWNKEIEKGIEEDVKISTKEIMNGERVTYYGIALAVTKIVEAILRDEKCILTTSTLVDGIYIGVPTIVGREGSISYVLPKLDDIEKDKFYNSIDVLKATLNDIKR